MFISLSALGQDNYINNEGVYPIQVVSVIYAPSASSLKNGFDIKFCTNASDQFVNCGNSGVNVISLNLRQSYPDPLISTTKISDEIKNNNAVELTIYNSNGQVVKKKVDEEHKHGKYAIDWNGNDNCNVSVSSSVSFYLLEN